MTLKVIINEGNEDGSWLDEHRKPYSITVTQLLWLVCTHISKKSLNFENSRVLQSSPEFSRVLKVQRFFADAVVISVLDAGSDYQIGEGMYNCQLFIMFLTLFEPLELLCNEYPKIHHISDEECDVLVDICDFL